GRALGCLRRCSTRVGLVSAEAAQLGCELAGLRRARIDPRLERRLESHRGSRRVLQEYCQTVGEAGKRLGRRRRGIENLLRSLGLPIELLRFARERTSA